MKLTADLIEAFSGMFLSPRYDMPQPTPDFHREGWRLYCSDHPQCVLAAPRNHAKSTSFTHDFILANVCFRTEDYIILVGASEDMAIEHLGDIANELRENEDLVREFGIKQFLTDQKTDVIVECTDGHQFRIVARGAEQKIRGRKWRGKRPGLIIGDDVEDDEQVESKDRRAKFFRWLLRACKQALRDGGRIRLHGTILHIDSALAKLVRHRSWAHLCYRAHAGFDDFSNILWPEKFPESRLRAIRQEFVDAQDAAGYSQEYLNDPLDNSDAYLRRGDFVPMSEDDYDKPKLICAAADFAVSKADMANRTSFTVGGKCPGNLLHIIDQYVGRWDPSEWMEIMFDIQQRWNPDVFWVEDGVIWKSVAPMIYREMQVRDIWINFDPRTPVKDKATRGRSLQRRMRAGGTRWDTRADWFPGMQDEMLRFTGIGEATLDDQFDSSALLSLGFDSFKQAEEDDFMSEEEQEFEYQREQVRQEQGRSTVTGY